MKRIDPDVFESLFAIPEGRLHQIFLEACVQRDRHQTDRLEPNVATAGPAILIALKQIDGLVLDDTCRITALTTPHYRGSNNFLSTFLQFQQQPPAHVTFEIDYEDNIVVFDLFRYFGDKCVISLLLDYGFNGVFQRATLYLGTDSRVLIEPSGNRAQARPQIRSCKLHQLALADGQPINMTRLLQMVTAPLDQQFTYKQLLNEILV